MKMEVEDETARGDREVAPSSFFTPDCDSMSGGHQQADCNQGGFLQDKGGSPLEPEISLHRARTAWGKRGEIVSSCVPHQLLLERLTRPAGRRTPHGAIRVIRRDPILLQSTVRASLRNTAARAVEGTHSNARYINPYTTTWFENVGR